MKEVQFMNLNSRKSLIARLRKGKAAREQFIESNLAKSLAYNLRATRDRLEWSQERLAAEGGMNQNAISRLESPDYGKQTITTLKRLAKAMDVGLVVRFVPFSELIDWVSGTRRIDLGLDTESLAAASFRAEEEAGIFDTVAPIQAQRATTAVPSAVPRVPDQICGQPPLAASAAAERAALANVVPFAHKHRLGLGGMSPRQGQGEIAIQQTGSQSKAAMVGSL
jgi:transcriptional regulator with XRE-family HTH domain